MRRSLPALLLLPLLAACSRTSNLPPEVVLERTVVANQAVESAHVEGTANVQNLSLFAVNMKEGVLRFEGDMQDGGRQLFLDLNLTGIMTDGDRNTMEADAALIVLDGRETYVRLNELNVSEENPANDPMRQIAATLAGHWWSLSPVSPWKEAAVTPDPHFLRMQSETVIVVRDNGIKSLDGRDVHLFDVRMDPVKLQAFLSSQLAASGAVMEESSTGTTVVTNAPDADGSLWIDTKTYLLHKARWIVRLKNGESVEFTISFSDHQKPVAIVPPNDALPFPSNASDLLQLLQTQNATESATMLITD